MTKRHLLTFTLFVSVAAAACGSKSKGTTTPPPDDQRGGDLSGHDMTGDMSGHDMDNDGKPDGQGTPVDGGTGAQVTDKPADPPPPDPAKIKADLLATETAAYQQAKPVLGKYCAGCHQKGGAKATAKKLDHFDMTGYPFSGHHAMEMSGEMRKVLGIGGGKPTMPKGKPGAVKGDDLALIAAWADAFDASHAGGAHEGAATGGHGAHKH